MDAIQKIFALILSLFVASSVVPTPISGPVQTNETSIVFTGDAMLGRTVTIEALDKQKDATYPFKEVAENLSSADLTFINLENPIVENCPRHNSGFTFCAPPEMIQGLTYAGVDIVTLANNHTLNYGRLGIEETQKHLDVVGISYTGISNLIEKEVRGIKFGFLGFDKSQQMNPKLTSEETTLIKESNTKVDVLIIGMHWGVEYKNIALPGVKSLARELVTLGADAVIGHHPHWVQDYEKIDGVPIYYSLGNFVFDQMWSEETRKGLIVKLTFEGTKIIKEELLPTFMKNWAQPEWVTE